MEISDKALLAVGFIGFLLGTQYGVLQLFKLTTYHRYFWLSLPVLVAYSAVVGWLLFVLKLHAFVLWQVVLASAWLTVLGIRQGKTAEAMLELAGDDADMVRQVAKSVIKTKTYYAASSITYIVVCFVTYLWLFNA